MIALEWLLAILYLVGGLNDLFLDLVFYLLPLRRALAQGRSNPTCDEAELHAIPEQRIAILVPAWDEAAIIGAMLESTSDRLEYGNYDIFVGTYPNDEPTQLEVARAAFDRPHIHRVVCPNPGPTSKADCLNWIVATIKLRERETGVRYEILCLQDAEDVVHPLTLKVFNRFVPAYDLVQLPVIPYERRLTRLTGGTYLDEFAEVHLKGLTSRLAVGGMVPSAGVGTAFSRAACDELAAQTNNILFPPVSLTEDYDFSFRLFRNRRRSGIAEVWVDRTDERGRPIKELVAIREFFPANFFDAIRQKQRWMLGIAFQGAQKLGWGTGWRERYMLLRDRVGVLTSLLNAVALFILFSLVFDIAWGLAHHLTFSQSRPPFYPSHALDLVIDINLLLLANRVVQRARCVGLVARRRQMLLTPIRLVWSNVIDFYCTVIAIRRYTWSRYTGKPLKWLKTTHEFPNVEALLQRHRPLGDLLLEHRFLTPVQLRQALGAQGRAADRNTPLGEILLAQNAITRQQLLHVLALQQHSRTLLEQSRAMGEESILSTAAHLAELDLTPDLPADLSEQPHPDSLPGRDLAPSPQPLTPQPHAEALLDLLPPSIEPPDVPVLLPEEYPPDPAPEETSRSASPYMALLFAEQAGSPARAPLAVRAFPEYEETEPEPVLISEIEPEPVPTAIALPEPKVLQEAVAAPEPGLPANPALAIAQPAEPVELQQITAPEPPAPQLDPACRQQPSFPPPPPPVVPPVPPVPPKPATSPLPDAPVRRPLPRPFVPTPRLVHPRDSNPFVAAARPAALDPDLRNPRTAITRSVSPGPQRKRFTMLHDVASRWAPSSTRRRIVAAVGTRPEAIKLAPVLRELRERAAAAHQPDPVYVCATGQHTELVAEALATFNVNVDRNLGLLAPGQPLATLSARILTGLESVLKEVDPEWMLVQGDTATAAMAALAAFYAGVRVAHVEAGLRTRDLANPFPEEFNRRMISLLASVHFAATPAARQNLLAEGIAAETIFVTGNTGIDALHTNVARLGLALDARSLHALDPDRPIRILITAHRRENLQHGIDNLCRAVRHLVERHPGRYQFCWPLHPNPQVTDRARAALDRVPGVALTGPVPYDRLLRLLSECDLILTDSGGLQEEAPSFAKPVLILREATERPEGIESGIARLVGTEPSRIVAAVERLSQNLPDQRQAPAPNPYGDGHAATRIADYFAGRSMHQFGVPAEAITADATPLSL